MQLILVLALGVFLLFAALRSQSVVRTLSQKYLKAQEQSNTHLNAILTELKRANRFLGEMSGAEFEPQQNGEENSTSPTKLYVGNIDYSATESELSQLFSQYGAIEFVNIPVNRYTGRARGFGFVSFVSPKDAERATVLNGSEFKGRQIQVNFAKERE